MSDPFPWSIRLGRWSGTQVKVHLFFVLFALDALLLDPLIEPGHTVAQAAAWLGLLIAALALHELGHAAVAQRLGLDLDEIRLWPLGSLNAPTPSAAWRTPDAFRVALAGPLVSGALALISAIGLHFIDYRMVLNPFGNGLTGGAPLSAGGHVAAPFTVAWCVGWFGFLNWVLFLANLIPALPMDGGRMLRAALSGPWFGVSRDSLLAPYLGRAMAIVLGLAGIVKLLGWRSGWFPLIALAVIIELLYRVEVRMLEDGGFFDDGVFGYDFSQGYTSLEAGTPTVRPYRESALRRWRRRRSELRRRRQEAKEAAEEQRMDEILAKLHRNGRGALTAEEERFLVRVSAKYRNRHRARG